MALICCGLTPDLAKRIRRIIIEHKGELHPQVRAAFDLPEQPVALLELDLDALLAGWTDAHEMADLSSQPPIYEDLALLVDDAVPAAQVADLIRQSGGKLLTDVRLFDVYRGGQIAWGALPNDASILEASPEGIAARLLDGLKLVSRRAESQGIDLPAHRPEACPLCAAGSAPP